MGESFKVVDNRQSAKRQEPHRDTPATMGAQLARVGRVQEHSTPYLQRSPSAMDNLTSLPPWLKSKPETGTDK